MRERIGLHNTKTDNIYKELPEEPQGAALLIHARGEVWNTPVSQQINDLSLAVLGGSLSDGLKMSSCFSEQQTSYSNQNRSQDAVNTPICLMP